MKNKNEALSNTFQIQDLDCELIYGFLDKYKLWSFKGYLF
jgi:hypothetical protein